MHSAVRNALLFALVFLALHASTFADALGETAWKEYVNARFGFKMSYPASLVASRDPENGDGREYHTKGDNCAALHFTYPYAKAAQYNPWVEKIVKSFEPFLQVHYYDRTVK